MRTQIIDFDVGPVDALLMVSRVRLIQLGRHGHVVVAMAGAHHIGLAGLPQFLQRVLPHRLKQPVSPSATGVFRLYVLKNIVHDWPDDKALKILHTVRTAAREGATVLLIESVLPPHNRDCPTKWLDLAMLVDNAGRERTVAEYRNLLQQSSFHMTRVVPTASPFSIVEARAVQ